MSASVCRFVVTAEGVAYLMARIVDSKTKAQVLQADLSAISYTVWELNPDGTEREALSSHSDVALVIADVFFDVLQTGEPWDTDDDATGYNFLATLWDAAASPFPNYGRTYRVLVTFDRGTDPPEFATFEARAV